MNLSTINRNQAGANTTIRIVQVTDPHLFANRDKELAGMNCDQSLTDVLDLIRRQRKKFDCLLCTGDLVQDASIEGYARLGKMLSSFNLPYLWIPGNHDLLDNIKSAVGEHNACLNGTQVLGEWKIIMLNSCVKGKPHGYLSADELAFLDRELARSQSLHTLIAVHHNAVPVQAEWLQAHSLHNSEAFFSVIDKYSQVKAVVCGHVHQDLEVERKGVMMLGSPSTCIQFHPTSPTFKLDDLNPGYRWLELNSDGSINTSVERVSDKSYVVDYASNGY